MSDVADLGPEMVMKREQAGKHLTQWAAQFAVASELCKRGYDVSLTMGNTTPMADLMALSPSGEMFLIDVKGMRKPGYWLVRAKKVTDKLFYVFALVPKDAPNQFFIMTQKTANAAIDDERASVKPERRNLPDSKLMLGVRWAIAEPHKDKWEVLPK